MRSAYCALRLFNVSFRVKNPPPVSAPACLLPPGADVDARGDGLSNRALPLNAPALAPAARAAPAMPLGAKGLAAIWLSECVALSKQSSIHGIQD
jgi:hypothetical protein